MDPLADVPRETIAKLHHFKDLLTEENARQNLVSATSLESFWERHILDSAQLANLGQKGPWADIGSGAGLPGIVLASLLDGPISLIEPRRLRADFLRHVAAELDLKNVEIHCDKVERMTGQYDVLTARAVAPLGRLLVMAAHLSHRGTRWVLPKGKRAKSELAEARHSWHCEALEVPSLTDPEATILVLTKVEGKRRR